MTPTWSPQQETALKKVDKWFYQDTKQKQIFRVFGYAGTGKTTLAKHFAEHVDGDVCFAAFTGKASLVMRKNGCEGARTIHSLIYIGHPDKKTGEMTWELNKASALVDASLLIIDECSMVNEEIAQHMLSFGVPILVLGDPAQLPPVDGAGYFTEHEPDVMLTEIHRQAEGNPIVHLATMVRNGTLPELGTYGGSRVLTKLSSKDALDADQIIVGRNVTREKLNSKMRRLLDLDPEAPVPGDRLVCLKNNKKLGIFNGGMFTVEQIIETRYKTEFLMMGLNSDDENRPELKTKIHKSFFMDDISKPNWKVLKSSQEMDYAYAITCHRAQGSQWDNVLVYDESWCFREHSFRWLYTAITRAKENVTIFKN